ncbi:MAG: hypothetical protein VB124_02840, partial [Burkholderia sp.]
IQSRMASRKTGLQVTPRSPSGSALATCRLIAKSCLNNRIRYIGCKRQPVACSPDLCNNAPLAVHARSCR